MLLVLLLIGAAAVRGNSATGTALGALGCTDGVGAGGCHVQFQFVMLNCDDSNVQTPRNF